MRTFSPIRGKVKKMAVTKKVNVPIYGSHLRLPIDKMDKVLSALDDAGFVLQDFVEGYVLPEIKQETKGVKL